MVETRRLEDFIYKEKIFPTKLINRILKEYKEEIYDRDSHHNKETRHLGSLEISSAQEINKSNSYERANIFELVKEQVEVLISEYMKYIKVENLPITEVSTFSMRKMIKGDWYGEHDDDGVGAATGSNKLTVSICLNDNYEGGEFTFFKQSLTYDLKKGDVLIFPSNFMYPHGVKKITKGTRYQLLLWLR